MADEMYAMGVKGLQLESPSNAMARILQLQQAQQGNQLRGMQMQEMQRGQAGESALARLLSQGGTPEDVAKGLATQGYGKQSLEYTKQQQELAKNKAAAEKDLLANTHKKLEIGSQLLSGATDQATYDQAKAQAISMGIDFSKLPPQFDPAFVQRTVQQGIDMKTQLEQKWKAMEYTTPKAGDVLQSETSRANNAATVGATIRGQNMVDARTREGTAAAISKPFEITGEDGKPVLVQQDKQGNIRPVAGYTPKQGASKPLNDTQAKALQFGSRMENANQIFDELAGKGVTTSIPGARAGYGIGAAINALQPADRQRLDQAKRDFINAVLRRESGAAISPSEFDSAEKQYFPQPGEAPAVAEQKKRARELSMRGILAEVPDSANRVKAVRGTPAAQNIDALLDKYK